MSHPEKNAFPWAPLESLDLLEISAALTSKVYHLKTRG